MSNLLYFIKKYKTVLIVISALMILSIATGIALGVITHNRDGKANLPPSSQQEFTQDMADSSEEHFDVPSTEPSAEETEETIPEPSTEGPAVPSTAPSTAQPTVSPTQPTTVPPTEPATVPPLPTLDEQAEQILNNMTLKEKICQMFVIAPENLMGEWNIQAAGTDVEQKLEEYPVAGFIFFEANLVEPVQTKTMLSNLQSYSQNITGLTFFTCIDEEGGRVAKVGNNAAFGVKKILAMNTIESEAAAYDAGYTIGGYLSELGFNFNFAPDADVLTNPANTVINDRSFGDNAGIVSKYAVAYAKGLDAHNVLSTFKHFPGHGGTEGDTHEGFAYTSKNLDELMQDELKPFIAAKDNNVDAIMIAHISIPTILGDNTPCSLSRYMITEVLRNQIGYNGLIITDALGMGAITNTYTNKEAAVSAVLAGNDILLKPADFYEAYAGVYEAVESGRITEARINESVLRIIKVKLQLASK